MRACGGGARPKWTDLSHRDGCFDPGRDGVYSAAEAQEVERLVLLADRVGGVDLCAFGIALLQRLLELCLFRCFGLGSFLGLLLELLGRKLGIEGVRLPRVAEG